MSTTHAEISIKAQTPGELAQGYNITTKTLKTWLRAHQEKIGARNGKYFTTLQVKLIYQCIGSPNPTYLEP